MTFFTNLILKLYFVKTFLLLSFPTLFGLSCSTAAHCFSFTKGEEVRTGRYRAALGHLSNLKPTDTQGILRTVSTTRAAAVGLPIILRKSQKNMYSNHYGEKKRWLGQAKHNYCGRRILRYNSAHLLCFRLNIFIPKGTEGQRRTTTMISPL